MNHRFGQKTKQQDEVEGSVAMELADILFVVVCIANSQGIDLDQAFAAMMQKVTVRDAHRWTAKTEQSPRAPAGPGPGRQPDFSVDPLVRHQPIGVEATLLAC